MRRLRPIATFVAVAIACTTARPAAAQQDSVARRQQRTLDSLAAELRALQARVDSAARGQTSQATGGDDLAAIRAAAAAATAGDTTPAAPQQARLGQNALNPEI